MKYSEANDFCCLITKKKALSIFTVLLFFFVLVNVFSANYGLLCSETLCTFTTDNFCYNFFFSHNNLFVSYADFQGDKDYHFTGTGIEWREQKKIQFLPAHEKDVKVDDSRITK